MAATDSVSVFAEGTFEEQIQELVGYIVRSQSEEERTTVFRSFQDALKTEEHQKPLDEDEERRKRIFSMVLAEINGVGDGLDREVEGFFNLIFSHLFALYPPETSEAKQSLILLLRTFSSKPSERPSVKYRILSNLFNATPQTSSLRLSVYNTLLAIAAANDEVGILQITPSKIEKWITEWDVSSDEKSIFLKSLVDVHERSGQPQAAYEYSRLYLRSLPSTSPTAQAVAVGLIATALRLPSIFDFDPLFKLDAVVAVKGHELFLLLQVFLNDNLPEFIRWESSHPDAFETYQLDRTQLQRKIKLLTFASLAFQHIGRDLPYSKIAEALQIDLGDVEKWAIDVIRAGLVWGKLSQTSQSLNVTRATVRTFEQEQWEALEKRLVAWKSGLSGVLEVIVNAKKQAGYGQPQNVA